MKIIKNIIHLMQSTFFILGIIFVFLTGFQTRIDHQESRIQFIQEINAKEVAAQATREQEEQLKKQIREYLKEKEAKESDPSERTENFLAHLVAYSIVGVVMALVYWIAQKYRKKSKK
ncbi:MAG: hypothetical protein ABIG73_00900 [Patescibacteria group bacterium]